jgi:hypothetical protein
MQVTPFFAFADRYFLRRALPHGIITWRYLLPHPPRKIRIHRQLWLLARPPRVPLALFFLIEFSLWLRWVVFAGPRRSWRVVQRRGAEIRKREGISKVLQMKRVFFMTLCHCIPPAEIYAFGLYRSEAKTALWNYIFTHELPAFHRWRSAPLGESQASVLLLQDKFRLTHFLDARGIPMAPVLALLSCGAPFDPGVWLQNHPRLFCKPRHGSGGRDAFVIEGQNNEKGAVIRDVKNGMAAQRSTQGRLQKAMARDDFLIQPFLYNHPDLADLSHIKDAVTVRIITEIQPPHGLRCYCATLEIPNDADDARYYHMILPIEWSSGLIMRFPEHRLTAPVQAHHDALHARMGNRAIPYWEEIRKSAVDAHQCFPDVYAIAWDYVITPDGPYMLEGNTGWGAATPQMLQGGLLQDEDKED